MVQRNGLPLPLIQLVQAALARYGGNSPVAVIDLAHAISQVAENRGTAINLDDQGHVQALTRLIDTSLQFLNDGRANNANEAVNAAWNTLA